MATTGLLALADCVAPNHFMTLLGVIATPQMGRNYLFV